MKKLLFGILTFLGIGLSFCSAVFDSFPLSVNFEDGGNCSFSNRTTIASDNELNGCFAFSPNITNYVASYTITFKDFGFNEISSNTFTSNYFCVPNGTYYISYSNPICVNNSNYDWQSYNFGYVVYSQGGGGESGGGESGGGESGGGESGGGGTPTPPSPYNGNIISSISGSNVVFSESSISSGIGEPMFFWYGQLLNIAIIFFPVIVVVSMFWLIYGYLKGLGNKNSLESKKSLDNK